ncbi:MAG: histidine kinase N-terminal 7TM domain-containing protein [Anaerolineae bacterium]|nr:histidine kinase N-terminal 7TM domain-containing protein [Anaerolineae bacterium]
MTVLFFSPYAIPLILAGIFAVVLAFSAWQRRSVPGGTTFTFLILALSAWLLAGAMEHLVPTLEGKTFWANVQFLGIPSVPVLWFIFVIKFTTFDATIKNSLLYIFLIYPLLTNILVWTNPAHHMFYQSISMDTSGIYPMLVLISGSLFWVHTAIAYMLFLMGTIMLMFAHIGSTGVYRKQTQLLMLSVIIPWTANLGYLLGLSFRFDITPFAVALSLAIIYVALQRFGFLEIIPIARHVVVDNLSDLVIVLDNKNRIVDLNPSACQQFNLTYIDSVGKYIRDVLPKSSYEYMKLDDATWKRDTIELLVNNEKIIFEMQIIPLYDRHSRFTGRILNLRDITVLRNTQQAMIENEIALRAYARELEEQNEELDAFAHTVAHDLKQPLAVLLGYSTFLTESLGSLDQEMLIHSTKMIEQNTRKMSNIVSELLLFANVRKKDTVEIKPVPMGEVVASVLSRLDDLIKQSDAHVVVPVAWPKAMGYASWIEEIWVNLISNAIKYGGKPPYVILDAEPMDIADGDHKGSWVRFNVTDNGSGITEEAQAQLFMPFERLGQVKLEGSGLGLSIVQRITRRLGGWIGVESAYFDKPNALHAMGSGSTFFFVLPAARQQSVE